MRIQDIRKECETLKSLGSADENIEALFISVLESQCSGKWLAVWWKQRASIDTAYAGGFEYDYFRQSRYTKMQVKSLSLYYSLT